MLSERRQHLYLGLAVSLILAACALPGASMAVTRRQDVAEQLQRMIDEVPSPVTGRVYTHGLDDHGKQLGALDPIADPAGGYLGVYHSPSVWRGRPTFRISLAHSEDLLHWRRIRVLDQVGASMPTLQPIPGTRGYLLAYEKAHPGGNLIRLAYFRSRASLLAGWAAARLTLPRRLSPYSNGTPTILWIHWRGSPARSVIGLGFHYQSQTGHRPWADRDAQGVLVGWRWWSAHEDTDTDAALFGQRLQGNHGDWRQFGFGGFQWRVYEGQKRFDDFATWHVLLYASHSGAVYPLSLEMDSLPITSVGNPIVREEPGPGGQGRVLVVTCFVFAAAARRLTGELVFYQPVLPSSG